MSYVIVALAPLLGIGTLLIGAAIAWLWDVPRRVVAAVMAFGAGVMIAVLAFELVAHAVETGGLWPVVVGFSVGALLYVAGDRGIAALARRRREREAASRNVTARRGGDTSGNGGAIAVGALLDGVPEAIAIGLSVISGFPVSMVVTIGLSNIPEGMAATVPLKASGRPARFVFGLWAGITAIAVAAAVVGSVAMRDAPPEVLAVMLSVAAGGLLAMVSNAMLPEAFEEDYWATGLLATVGFLVAFVVIELG
jgi:ZIP family zinc transporter